MANKSGVVNIALNVDYDKSLQQMVEAFNQALTQMSNKAEKIEYIGDIKEQVNKFEKDLKGLFEKVNKQQINSDNFDEFRNKVTKDFNDVEKKFASINTKIYDLRKQLGLLDGSDFATNMKKQFDDLSHSLLQTLKGLEGIVDLTKIPGKSPVGKLDDSTIRDYKTTLAMIKQFEAESAKTITGRWGELKKELEAQEGSLRQQITLYDELNAKMSSVDPSSPEYLKLENELVRIQIKASEASAKIQNIFNTAKDGGFKPTLGDDTKSLIARTDDFVGAISGFEDKVRKMIRANKEAQESVRQTQTTFNTFQIKDGEIHVPIDIIANSVDLKSKINDIIQELKAYAENTPIIAPVKLVLDKSSSSGYVKNSEVDKKQIEGQAEPTVDIAKAIQKTYRDAAREAKQIVKTEIKNIQEEFENVPIKIKPDSEAFTKDLKKMINTSFKQIAEETSGVKVNEELEKLVANLKEVSTSLSGNESFKLGLDEASIERITAAIQNMADMIQRAFGVASNDDISAQWTVIESKFKGVAGEEGKLLKGNKEHKIAIQELAVEYKKYLDMGGKNDLSNLTAHKQTIKNITAEYESLGKAAQEAAQKQEKVAKKPASTKVSSEEADAIKSVTKQNKSLETQAGKTGTALDKEGKAAQDAAGKFRKLAKEKGAAVYANRELAKAAKETADALERETNTRKETERKPSKNAVDGSTYASNFLKWQFEIEKSLKDSGNYADVYEAKISQATNGTVKFTAVVRTLDGELKKFSANVNDTGGIFSPSIGEMGEKQAADFEKRLIIAEKIREAIMAMDGEGVEPIHLNRKALVQYVDDIQKALQELEKLDAQSKATYRLDLTTGGKLAIVRKEISDTGAEAKAFTVVIDSIDDIFDETANGAVVSIDKIREALEGALDSGKISTSTKDFTSKAQEAFDKFTLKHKGDSNCSEVGEEIREIEKSILSINSQDSLNEFKQNLSDIAVKLNNIGKDNKLGKIIGGDKTFKDISEVRANIDSLFASMGKVDEKSIKINGTNKLTAEVKAANGEIRKMNVSLDSNSFARYVDAGIVQFSRLRAAAEGVFKGIQSMVRIYLSPQDFIRYFRQGFDAVREIDTAMTELRKVSDASPGDITAYFDDAVESAKELGSSVNEMIGATADWQRMGMEYCPII